MNKKLKNIIYIVLEICMLFGILYIAKYCYDIYSSENEKNLLNEIIVENMQEENLSQEEDKKEIKTERMLKLEELQKENDDIIGWIEIENTNINYPVLQGSDNKYYLTHNYKKKYSVSGAIFLDKDYKWDPPSDNLLIYGHDKLFKDILKYKEKKFYNEHPIIRFTTSTEDVSYEILSAFYSKVYYKSDKNVFKYYYFINSKNEKEYNEFVNNAKKASLYDTGKTAKYGDQLLTLSTCSYHTKDGRFAIVAKKSLNYLDN